MNPELKGKWVEALRSGEYKQGQFTFRNGDRYCCLGVLCMVLSMPQLIVLGKDDYDGLRNASGLVQEDTDTLVRMNDHRKRSFKEISDYIEANL